MSVKRITLVLLELQVADTFVPFTEAVKSMAVPEGEDVKLYEVVSGEIVTVEDVVHVLPTQTVAVPLTAPLEVVFVTVMVTESVAVIDRALITPPLVTLTAEASELLQAVPVAAVRFCVVLSL